jgi:N,N'-diacetyllegionaminate synthase
MPFRDLFRLPQGNAVSPRCLIIGEVAQSHDGSVGTAHAFIDAIANAGADAVKFQTHIAAAESTPSEPWRVKFSRQDATRYEYWRRMEFTEDQWRGLKEHAEQRGLLFLSSPFSLQAIELLERLGISAWKVASGEVNNLPMLERLTHGGRPLILSSGMSSMEEVRTAVELVNRPGNPLAVLQCTSAYPCPPEKVGLNVMTELQSRFNCPVGLSDHSGTIYPGLSAVTLGAEVLEIHVAFSREMFGPDVPASITTTELAQLVEGVRFIERMIDNPVDKEAAAGEMAPLRSLFTKSIVARTNLSAGTLLSHEHLTAKKPGAGVPAARLPEFLGNRLKRDLSADEMLCEADVEGF